MRVRNVRYNDLNTFVTNLRFQWLFLVAEMSITTTKINTTNTKEAEWLHWSFKGGTFRLRYGRHGRHEVLIMFKTVA